MKNLGRFDSFAEIEDDLARYGEDPEQGFATFKNDFIRCDPYSRRELMRNLDSLLEGETRITRQHAEWVTRKRELVGLDSLLKRAGR